MRITGLSTVVVNAEMRNWVFVKVQTDEGLVGWGEATVEWKTRAVVACVEDLASLVIGEDPRRVVGLLAALSGLIGPTPSGAPACTPAALVPMFALGKVPAGAVLISGSPELA